jgi:hypothetical protein
MKIMVLCSKHFYEKAREIINNLEKAGHKVTPPNSFDDAMKEERLKKLNKKEHSIWKQKMMRLHGPKIKKQDAVLILNLEKKGIPNYIGGATFMEIIKAWELNKKIFLYNSIPKCSFTDEITAINPIILNKDLSKIK